MLVIEDEPVLLESIVTMLEIHGFTTVGVKDGTEALALLSDERKKEPRLILCDLNLPDMNGLDILKFVKSDSRLYKVPFIILTAFADEREIRAGMNLGADDYLTKPFAMDELISTLEARLVLAGDNMAKFEAETNNKWHNIFDFSFRQEFFTPLNSLLNAVSYMKQSGEFTGNVANAELLNAIHTSGLRMFRNSRNLLMYSLLSVQEIVDVSAPVPGEICTVFQDVIDAVRIDVPDIDAVGLCNASEPHVGEASKYLNVLFTELVDNAIKFSRHPSLVKIRFQCTPHSFSLDVINPNSGYRKFSLADVRPFNKFHEDKTKTGLGLGLSLAKMLCSLLKFDLRLDINCDTITVSVKGITT